MGALGCGELLMQLVLEEMEAAHAFDYAVVQATESSAGFYDKMGFVRVGAIAKYIKPGEERQAVVIPPVAYRHFVGPDQDVREVDHSIMMAIRLRAGHVPRRVLASKGGVFANLGRDVPVGLSAAALDSETVHKLLSSDISGGDIEAKVVGDTLVLGPGASDFSLRLLAEHMGGEQWERAKAVLCEAQDHKDEIVRPGRASSEIARRKMNLWLSPTAHRPWTCYGTIPETTSEEGWGKRSAGGKARRGNRVIRTSTARVLNSPRSKGVTSPGMFSAEETPRRRKPGALDLTECIDGKKHIRAGRCGGDGISPLLAESSPTGGISRLRKETVRDICMHLNIPTSRKLPFVKLNATKSKQQLITSLLKHVKDSPIAWVNSDALTFETLQNMCFELHLPSEGPVVELRRLLMQTLTENLGEYLSLPRHNDHVSEASPALHNDRALQKKRPTSICKDVEASDSGSKRAEKAEDRPLWQTLYSTNHNGQSETCVWDLVVCEACKSGEDEERIVLCDGCDLAYHLECATPALDDIPEGEWYCMVCTESRREEAERERKAQEMREERNRKERERRAREKLQREEEERDRKLREEQDEVEREKQHEREERQRKAREQREKRLEEERLAKERERERKLQQERDRKAKELRDKEERERDEKEERERKLKEKEAERERRAKAQAEKESQRTLEKAPKEASVEAKVRRDSKDGKKEGDGKKEKEPKESDVRTPRGPRASLSTYSACCAPIDCSDWDVADDDDGKMAWNQKLKHTWYGGPGMEWLSKETLRCLCQDLDVGINRKLPCTKITVAKSKQQLIGSLERWCQEQPFEWVEEQQVTAETLQAVCSDLCINAYGHVGALRNRIRNVFDNPDVYVQRMFTAQGEDATSGMINNPWDQIECEKCRSTTDEERMVLCDMCDSGYHIYCLEPKLKAIPEGEWICKDCRKSKAPDSKHKRKRSKCDQGDSSPTDSSPTESACALRDAARDLELKPSPRSRSSCVPCNPKRSCPEGDTQKAGKSPRGSLDGAEDGGSGKKISKKERDGGASTPWDLVECQVCGSTQDEERMILCDVCDGGYHLYCADPALKKVPEGDWICQECVAQKAGKKRRRRRTQAEMLLERTERASLAAASAAVFSSNKGEGMSSSGSGKDGVVTSAFSAESTNENPWALVECQMCGCGEGEDRIILCDVCDGGYHLECADPPLDSIPDGEWLCLDCKRARKRAQTKKEQDKKFKAFQDRVQNAEPALQSQSKVSMSGRPIVPLEKFRTTR